MMYFSINKTIYKNVANSGSYIQPFNSYLTTLQKCLPYWCVLQAVGHQGVMQRIKHSTDLVTTFCLRFIYFFI